VLHNCAPTEDLQQRVAQLFDQRLAQSLIPCSHTTKDGSVTISGVITDNTYARYDRSDIFFFVNQRWVKNQPLARALLKGYANTLPPGRFPAACLFITVKSDAVDINVHPRKEEVLFLHPKVVETALCGMVSSALEQGLSKRLHATTLFQKSQLSGSYGQFKEQTAEAYQSSTSSSALHTHSQTNTVYQKAGTPSSVDSETFLHTSYTAHHEPLFFGTTTHSQDTALTYIETPSTACKTKTFTNDPLSPSQSFLSSEPFIDEPLITSAEFDHTLSKDEPLLTLSHQQTISTTTTEEQALQRHMIIGQLHKTYIMLEHPDGLYVVDQHAAHERIIYERLAQRFEDAATIQLLFPIIVSVGAEQSERLLPHLALLHQIGIGIEQFSPTEVIITATPVQAQTVDYAELIRTIIGWLHEYDNLDAAELSRHVNEKLRAQIACKAAVKAGDELTREQMEQLLVDLSKTDNRFSCPHGRPTGWLLGTYEIEKRFRRKQ
jgi:DNA mismatch repair protein MutL